MHCQLINRLSTFDALEQKAYWLANNQNILMNINYLININILINTYNIFININTIVWKERQYLNNTHVFIN